MRPRIDIVALADDTNMSDILQTAIQYRYSRIPIFHKDIDNIVGMVICKDLLAKAIDIQQKTSSNTSSNTSSSISSSSDSSQGRISELTAAEIMEATYFIPETMTLWTAMQELRKRRLQMAIVVDEYGGTAGLVTFEDILEQVL